MKTQSSPTLLFIFIKKITYGIVLLFILSFLSSCSQKFYAPNDANMMVLRKKDDAQASLASGLFNLAVDGQAAYSPLQHLRVSGSIFYRGARGEQGDGNFGTLILQGNGVMFSGEVGGYHFLKINKHKEKEGEKSDSGFIFDAQQGFSHGRIYTKYSDNKLGKSLITFNKTYQQLGVHWVEKFFEFGYALRFGQLQYRKVRVRGIIDGDSKDRIESLNEINRFNTMESSFRTSINLKTWKFYTYLTVLHFNNDLIELGTFNANFGGGFLFHLDGIFQKKKKIKKKKRSEF